MKSLSAVSIFLFFSFVAAARSGAPEMTWEQYQVEISGAIEREKVAREGIAQEQAQIENLKQLILQTDNSIFGIIQDIYRLLGITEQDVVDAENELSSIRSGIEPFTWMDPADLIAREQELLSLESRFSGIKQKKVCWLFRIAKKVDEIEQLLARAKEQLALARNQPAAPAAPPQSPSSYTVGGSAVGSTCLWKISEEVYGDKYQWPRIYRANRRLIDNGYNAYRTSVTDPLITRPQDFVCPGWVLEIPQ